MSEGGCPETIDMGGRLWKDKPKIVCSDEVEPKKERRTYRDSNPKKSKPPPKKHV